MTDREVLEKLAEEWFSHRLLHPAKLDLDGLLKPYKKPDQTPFQKWHAGCPVDTELKYTWNAALNAVWGSVYDMESGARAVVRDAIDNNWENG